jgi:membrane fusion protein
MSQSAAFQADDDASPAVFLESDPPHWAARGLTYILSSLLVGLVLISVALKIPETVSGSFVLVPAGGDRGLQAKLIVPESGLALIEPGQSVKLLYDAFPYQRYGMRYGTVRSATPASLPVGDGTVFVVLADLAEQAVPVNGQAKPVLPGMRGTARIVVGSRSLLGYALEPVRGLRETVAQPPDAGAPSAGSERGNAS